MGYEQSKSMAMRDMYIDSDRIYFSNHTFNALISMDKISGEFRYLKSFNGVVPWMKALHRRIIMYKESLFFFPDDSKGISKYNLVTGEIDFFKAKEKFMQVADAFLFGKNAYLVPRSIKQPFYVFDMERCRYESRYCWNLMIIEKLGINYEIFIWPPCIIERTIWVLVKNLNVVIETSIDDWSIELYFFDKDLLFDSITSDGKNIWLSSGSNDVIICWNKSIGLVRRYVLSEFRNSKMTRDISRLIFVQDRIFVLPKMGNELFVINLSGRVEKIIIPHLQRVHDLARESCALFSECVVYEGEVYLLPLAANKMYRLSLCEYKITEFDMTFFDIETYYKNIVVASEIWQDKEPIIEYLEQYHEGVHQNVNLFDYLYIIITDIQSKERITQEKETCGHNIFELIKRMDN